MALKNTINIIISLCWGGEAQNVLGVTAPLGGHESFVIVRGEHELDKEKEDCEVQS